MEDFGASDLDAAAVFGNAGYESLGFAALQESTVLDRLARGSHDVRCRKKENA